MVMRSYDGMLPENLRTFDTKGRHGVYRNVAATGCGVP